MKNNQENNEIEYKLILLGDTSVGKTCLYKKITQGIFADKIVSTVDINRKTFKIECDLKTNV